MEVMGFAATFLMGITLGLMGGGGSILTVPILVYLFQISPIVATGFSLFVVGVTALVGCLVYVTKREVNYKIGLTFAIPSILGVNLSRGLLLPSIPETICSLTFFTLTKEMLIMVIFAALMIGAASSMLQKQTLPKLSTGKTANSIGKIALLGFLVGAIAGFVGAGGGFLILPALVILARLSMRTAVGTSLLIIAIQSLMGFGGDVLRGANVQWSLLLSIAAVAVVGILIGSVFANKVKEQKLKTVFGWFVLVMGTVILMEQLL